MYIKTQIQEQKKMNNKLKKGEITGEEWSNFLDKDIEKGRENWKGYMKKHR